MELSLLGRDAKNITSNSFLSSDLLDFIGARGSMWHRRFKEHVTADGSLCDERANILPSSFEFSIGQRASEQSAWLVGGGKKPPQRANKSVGRLSLCVFRHPPTARLRGRKGVGAIPILLSHMRECVGVKRTWPTRLKVQSGKALAHGYITDGRERRECGVHCCLSLPQGAESSPNTCNKGGWWLG